MFIAALLLWTIAGPLLLAKIEAKDGWKVVQLQLDASDARGWIRIFSAGPAVWLVVLRSWLKMRTDK